MNYQVLDAIDVVVLWPRNDQIRIAVATSFLDYQVEESGRHGSRDISRVAALRALENYQLTYSTTLKVQSDRLLGLIYSNVQLNTINL